MIFYDLLLYEPLAKARGFLKQSLQRASLFETSEKLCFFAGISEASVSYKQEHSSAVQEELCSSLYPPPEGGGFKMRLPKIIKKR